VKETSKLSAHGSLILSAQGSLIFMSGYRAALYAATA